jgi:hypothetical protein
MAAKSCKAGSTSAGLRAQYWLVQPDGDRQRLSKRMHSGRSQRAHIVSERRFLQAEQLIAVDARLLFHPLVHADSNLRAQTIVPGINRRADHRAKSRIDDG